MSASTSTQVLDVPANDFLSGKFNLNGVNQHPELPTPPHVVVRARSITEGIEMNVLGRTWGTNEITFPDEDIISMTESEFTSKKEWVAIAACGLCLFLSGWHDGGIGPLLPTIQKHYNLSFTVVSVLFVSACTGFLLAAVLNMYLSDRFGFGRLIFLGGVCQIISYAILVPALPFPAMALAFVLTGFGIGLQDALANGFVSALRNNPSVKMGVIQSLYGAGAFVSPLVATQFANHPRWSYHYMVPLVISSLNLVFLFSTFRFHTQEELLGPIQSADPVESGSNERKYRQMFGLWAVQAMAIFSVLYVGAETTMGGWFIMFIVEKRGGGTSAGYITSGFYGGMMLGRIGLIWLNKKVGERRMLYAYALLAIACNGVAASQLARKRYCFRLCWGSDGPMYPIAMNVLRNIIPKWLMTGSIGWIESYGRTNWWCPLSISHWFIDPKGMTYGVGVLQPIYISLLGGMMVVWALVPSSTKRRGD
ncbi:unnamed protein product [Rhizoctonia solani]|uniref:Major facilitator superfamily (MFS) profile domain-containing protein n=1 Tax=Rhizoctonia solani TaxID=456999 RepID=A0A8H2XDT6_9AGAM|nr:unnamed protein product [Rhizoctonia solani]